MKHIYVYRGELHDEPEANPRACEYILHIRTPRPQDDQELQELMLRMLEPEVLSLLNDTSKEVCTRVLYEALMNCPKYKGKLTYISTESHVCHVK